MNLRKSTLFVGLLIAIVCYSTYASSIEVSGTVSSDTIWDADTILVTGDISISDGITLTIKPGTYVEFQGYYKIDVKGTLLAQGAAGDSIIFTIADTAGFGNMETTAGGWQGIWFESTSSDNDSSIIAYCRIEYKKHTQSRGKSGAIYLREFSKVYIHNSTIVNNHNSGNGGAINCYDCSPRIENNTIAYNTGYNGGGIFSNESNTVITNNRVMYNHALHGGGIYGTGIIKYNEISNNSAGEGGGIRFGKGILEGNVIKNNSAEWTGGGIYSRSVWHDDSSLFWRSTDDLIRYNTIENNQAGTGGGIYCFLSTSLIKGNRIAGNSVTGSGGGIGIEGPYAPIVIHNSINKNSAQENGGGIAARSHRPGSKLSIKNNIISSNTASGDGGALYIVDFSSPFLVNNTMVYNTAATCGGIYYWDSFGKCHLVNTILWGNSGSQIDGNMRDIIATYCNIQGGYKGIGNINIDPQFTGSANGDFSLTKHSHCINTGKSDTTGLALPEKDIAGKERIYEGFRVDIGAFEFQGDCPDPIMAVTPTTIDTALAKNMNHTFTFIVTNVGKGALIIDSVRVKNKRPFIITKTIPVNTVLNFMQSDTVEITFSSAQYGIFKDTLSIYSNDTVKKVGFLKTLYFNTIINTENVAGVWKKAHSPYGISEEVIIQEHDTLMIEPGVTVASYSRYGGYLVVKGNLQAKGDSNDYITFTVADTTGFGNELKQACVFWGIIFDNAPGDSSILSFCKIEYSNGSGIGINGTGSWVRVESCIITHNNRSGIYCQNGSPLFKNNIIAYNYTEAGGGGISCCRGSPVFVNNMIIKNSAEDEGGGFYCSGGSPVLINNVIANNYTEEKGGGIYCTYNTNPIALNNTITNNAAQISGGGVFVDQQCSPVFANTILWANTGGQIEGDLRTVQATYCTIEGGYTGIGNSDIYPAFIDSFSGNWSLTQTSRCINMGKPDTTGLNLPQNDIAGNERIFNGVRVDIGAYEFQGSYPEPQISVYPDIIDTIVFDNSERFFNCIVENTGGKNLVIHSIKLKTAKDFTLSNTIPNNTVLPFAQKDTITLSFSGGMKGTFTDTLYIHTNDTLKKIPLNVVIGIAQGTVSGTWTKENSPYAIFGDIAIPYHSTLTINPGVTVLFHGNYKLDVDGTLRAIGTKNDSILFTIADTSGFWDTSSAVGGWHGIRFDSTASDNDSSILSYCIIEYGKKLGKACNEHGGALYIYKVSKLCISHCSVRNNYAKWAGGGIYSFESKAALYENTITNNFARRSGGGIYCSGECLVMNNILSNNRAQDGGGIACNNLSTISNNIISDNYASRGGGIKSHNNCVLKNNTISNNEANYGGGVHVDKCHVVNNVIVENYVEDKGGGIYCYNTADTDTSFLINNVIAENAVENNPQYGAGIFCGWSSAVKIINNTIVNNKGYGISNDNSSVIIMNTILWANSDKQISDSHPEDIRVSFTTVQDGFPGQGNNAEYPEFTDSANNDWSLTNKSHDINRGRPDTTGLYLPRKDIAGNNRIYNGYFVDRGAYEYQGNCVDPLLSVYPLVFDTALSKSKEGRFVSVVTNVGIGKLTIDSIKLAYGNPFTIIETIPNNTSISFSENDTVLVGFSSSQLGTFRDTLYIYSGNSVEKTAFTVLVVGTAIQAGPVSGTWEKGKTPYGIFGDITILNNTTLTINAGVDVDFYGPYSLNVDGTLLAKGNANDSVIFKGVISCWHGIKFDSTASQNDSSILSFCRISNSNKGALLVNHVSKLRINNSIIRNNGGGGNGKTGGIRIREQSSPMLINCVIAYNGCNGIVNTTGGVSISNNSNPILSNCIIAYNGARCVGGMSVKDSSCPQITNSIIAFNQCDVSCISGIYAENMILTNSIIWGNFPGWQLKGGGTITYCDYPGGVIGQGNISVDPLLIQNGGYLCKLSPGSPCINAGNPDTTGLFLPEYDIMGNPRIYMDTVDIGPHEAQNLPPYIIKPIADVIAYEDDSDTVAANLRAMFSDLEDGNSNDLIFTVAENTNNDLVEAKLIYPKSGSPYMLSLSFLPDSNGTAEIVIKAADSIGAFVFDTFSVLVNPVNDTPSIISNISDTTISVDKEFKLRISASDPDKFDILSWQLYSSPAGMEIGELNGVITWMPSPADTGQHTVSVCVKDLAGTADTVVFDITVVKPVNIVDEDTSKTNNMLPVFIAEPNPALYGCGEIRFFLTCKTRINAKLCIYDAVGNRIFYTTCSVNALEDSKAARPFALWDMRNKNGKRVSPGTYIAILKTENYYGESNIYRVVFGIKNSSTH